MDEFPRRTFCGLLAAAAGTVSGCNTMSQGSATGTTTADESDGDGDVRLVTSKKELEDTFDSLSPGDTIHISGENAPYRTTQWLDIDVNGVTVVGPDVQTLIKPANGANVGGIRIGHNERCASIDIRGVGYHGNPKGQQKSAKRLHGIAVRDAANVTIERCQIRRTWPVEHGTGGSGISVSRKCSDVRILNNQIREFGDRGVQIGNERTMIFGNVVTNGLDRPIACDLWSPKATNPAAQSVSIFGNLLGNSVEGSLIGIARNTSASPSSGYVSIYGNVGFGSHKSFCHVRGPQPLQNISIQNNVSIQETDGLDTEQTTKFAGIAVDVAEGKNVTVKNNELYGYSGHGIHVNSEVQDFTIQQNTFAKTGLAGIRVVDATNGLVCGNRVTNTTNMGIRLKQVSNTVVRGNYIHETGTAGIVVGGSESSTGNELLANYIAENNQKSSEAYPAIIVRDGGVRVRGNSIRQNGAAAIAESDSATGNIYEDNWADGNQPWRFAGPTSYVRNNIPPTDVHQGVSAGSDNNEVTVEFDQPYARPPQLTFGRANGGIEDVSYETNENGNFVAATITIGQNGGTLDVFLSEP